MLGRLTDYARWRARPNPPATLPSDLNVPRAWEILRKRFRAAATGGWLDPLDTVQLLRCFGIPVIDTRFAATTTDAQPAVRALNCPVAVKAVAEGVMHKSEHGGVILDVRNTDDVRAAIEELRGRFGAALRGVLLQPMATRGRELLIAAHSDATFGPLVVFGLGGVDTDLIADRTARLAPLSDADTDDLLHGLRCSGALFEPDATPALDTTAVRNVLLRVGHLAHLLPEVTELDLNPVIVWPDGCQVLDARIRVTPGALLDPFLPALRG